MANICIDLETLGTKSGAVITQIGLVAFTRDRITDEAQIYVDAEDCQRHGLTIDASSVLWWLKQSDAARKHFELKAQRLIPALTDTILFFNKNLDKDSKVWGNGSDFDNAILQAAFEKVGTEVPWKFWQNACYRTVKSLVKSIPADNYGTAHVAVDDAKKQALHLIKIAQATGLPL